MLHKRKGAGCFVCTNPDTAMLVPAASSARTNLFLTLERKPLGGVRLHSSNAVMIVVHSSTNKGHHMWLISRPRLFGQWLSLL